MRLIRLGTAGLQLALGKDLVHSIFPYAILFSHTCGTMTTRSSLSQAKTKERLDKGKHRAAITCRSTSGETTAITSNISKQTCVCYLDEISFAKLIRLPGADELHISLISKWSDIKISDISLKSA